MLKINLQLDKRADKPLHKGNTSEFSEFRISVVQWRNEWDVDVVSGCQISRIWGWALLVWLEVQWWKRISGTKSKCFLSTDRYADESTHTKVYYYYYLQRYLSNAECRSVLMHHIGLGPASLNFSLPLWQDCWPNASVAGPRFCIIHWLDLHLSTQ